MFKFLKGVVGSSGGVKDLPYNIGEPYSSAWGSWTHYRGTSKDDNSPVSIFSLSCTSTQDGRLGAARNGVKRLRTVRHPNVLSFLHSTEVETVEGSLTKLTIYMVTEPVMPLAEKLKELNLEGTHRDEYYAWGLHQIAKAVSFLNNDCKLVHGNICVASVVVTPNLDWKIHAFDVLSEFDSSNPDSGGPMLQYDWLIGSQYKSMELSKSDWALIRKSPVWAIDSWGLGCLIYEIFSGAKLSKTEDLRNTAFLPKTLLPDYQRLLGSTPSRRMNPSKLINNSEFFQNKLVETIQFLDILNLKDSVEKDAFFRKLVSLAEQLPRQIVLAKVLPMLAAALEFGSASASALNPLLKLGSWLSVDDFNVKVLPTLTKLFASNDRGIRVGLLQHIDQFGSSLSSQVVDEQVFPHLANGFSDTSAFLRELTLKAMLILVPKLSQRTISGSLLKYLSKLQVDEEPAIRTNTTILIGNIAAYLNEATRKRVLINAFTVRALRDGFAPARSAGIMALSATSLYYDITEIGTRILPSLVVLTVDGDSDVRSKAFEATERFLNLVKQGFGQVETDGEVSTSLSSTNTAGASILGWAMSSLTMKGKTAESSALSTNITSLTVTNSTENITAAGAHEIKVSKVQTDNVSTKNITESSVPSNGWGDMDEDNSADDDVDKDGWDDMESFESPVPSALSRIQAAQQRPVQAPPRVSSTNSVSSAEEETFFSKPPGNSGDYLAQDDDPWAAIAAPPPSTTVKPLSLSGSRVAGPTRVRQAQHVSIDSVLGKKSEVSGRGRGRAGPMKLGAQRINRSSD
ncbi:hypothetical protein KP509_35G029600 [Ceratopteris richardii]|uniref:Protein kinase domain-containing protein n=4 Tax=Ceratopteris richardii TaxID=49495 RepID=A0A8T2QFM2_CERRI|nr:hypothetical protein KP509_35G029600 [Ceratopteris richardii]KAH7282410.1 hypothetical protein KP509_35G029600 [Ceratopteris richardii]KAH7282411.1 hypothetical protein KP509_35G029600 [Ceratopteris richardii]KAH7282413.1 hypothetical protein KP509_35G029600 [Ceratopteris richardii]